MQDTSRLACHRDIIGAESPDLLIWVCTRSNWKEQKYALVMSAVSAAWQTQPSMTRWTSWYPASQAAPVARSVESGFASIESIESAEGGACYLRVVAAAVVPFMENLLRKAGFALKRIVPLASSRVYVMGLGFDLAARFVGYRLPGDTEFVGGGQSCGGATLCPAKCHLCSETST